jgi:glycerate kinase
MAKKPFMKALVSKPSILITPASFKGSLSAPEAATVMAEFLTEQFGDSVRLIHCPVADGGDDTLSVLQWVEPAAERIAVRVTGPVANLRVSAEYLWLPHKKTVVIEAAQAHGLKLLGGNLAPMAATSYGVGELIQHALAKFQPENLVVTVGGSASTDGGLGALQALGFRFEDALGQTLETPIGGQNLLEIERVVFSERTFSTGRLLIATDVINLLLGPEGTAFVFAPQKGADAKQCEQLALGLLHVSRLMALAFRVDLTTLPGVGAAGGLAYGLRHLPRSGIISGSHWLAEALDLPQKIVESDLILTGEGRFDLTSLSGKATGNLLGWAGDKPVVILCGQAEAGLGFQPPVYLLPLAEEAQAVKACIDNPKLALRTRLQQAVPLLQTLLRLNSPKPTS